MHIVDKEGKKINFSSLCIMQKKCSDNKVLILLNNVGDTTISKGDELFLEECKLESQLAIGVRTRIIDRLFCYAPQKLLRHFEERKPKYVRSR